MYVHLISEPGLGFRPLGRAYDTHDCCHAERHDKLMEWHCNCRRECGVVDRFNSLRKMFEFALDYLSTSE